MNKPKLERCPMTRDEAIQILLDSNTELASQMAQLAESIESIPEERHGLYDQMGYCQREYDAVEFAVDFLRRAPLPDNKALTAEELRGMDGEPVWIVAHPDWGHWELSERAEDYFEDRDEDFYGMTMPPALPDPMGRYGLHMLGWLAYRRPPEKGE